MTSSSGLCDAVAELETSVMMIACQIGARAECDSLYGRRSWSKGCHRELLCSNGSLRALPRTQKRMAANNPAQNPCRTSSHPA